MFHRDWMRTVNRINSVLMRGVKLKAEAEPMYMTRISKLFTEVKAINSVMAIKVTTDISTVKKEKSRKNKDEVNRT